MKPYIYYDKFNESFYKEKYSADAAIDGGNTVIELFTLDQLQQFAIIACTVVGSPIALGKVQQAMEAAEGIVEYLEKGK